MSNDFDVEGFFGESEDIFIEKKEKSKTLQSAKHDLEVAEAKLKVIKAKKLYEEMRG